MRRVVVAWLAVTSGACGRIGFDPLGDGGGADGGGPLGVGAVQHGVGTFGSGTDMTEPIADVDPAHSFLVFTTAVASTDPASGQISGRIEDGNRLHFERNADGPDVTVSWYVVTHEDLLVASGTSMGDGLPPIPSVDLATTFPLVSWSTSGADYNEDDYVRARLAGPQTLALEIGAGGTLPELMDWQLVSWTGAKVTTMENTLGANASGVNQQVTVDVNHAFAQLTWSTPLDMIGIGCNALQASLAPTVATLRRDRPACWAVPYTLSVVEMGGRTQSGVAEFAANELTKVIDVSPVRSERTFAMLSGRGGSTGLDGMASADDIGASWFTADLVDNAHLVLTRASTGSMASAAWYVVELP